MEISWFVLSKLISVLSPINQAAAENNNGNGGYIYTSINSGYNWTQQTGSGARDWEAIASSADGKILFAVEGAAGFVWMSQDYGVTWISSNETSPSPESITLGSYTAVSCSDDGQNAVAVRSGDTQAQILYYDASKDPKWNEAASSSGLWTDTSMSSNAATSYAVQRKNTGNNIAGKIYVSTDKGDTWSKKSPTGDWRAVATNEDGKKAVVADFGGYLYITIDGGNNWAESAGAGTRNWYSLDVSNDFTTIIAADDNNGYIWKSIDSGATWSAEVSGGERYWYDTTCNENATVVAGVVTGGSIYTDFNCSIGHYMSSSGTCKSCPVNSNSSGGVYTCTCDACSTGSVGSGDELVCYACPFPENDDDAGENDVGLIVGVLICGFLFMLITLYFVWKCLVHKNAQKEGLNELLKANIHGENPMMQMESQQDERRSEKM